MHNPHIAFAVGYFYGRCSLQETKMPTEDSVYVNSKDYKDGYAAGQRDFQEIDLPLQAVSGNEVQR